MPRAHYEPLNVFLNSRLVGQLRRELSGAISFQYDSSWLDWEFVMPVSLSLPLRKQAYSGAPVVAVFDNLLPDNDDLRRKIAAPRGRRFHSGHRTEALGHHSSLRPRHPPRRARCCQIARRLGRAGEARSRTSRRGAEAFAPRCGHRGDWGAGFAALRIGHLASRPRARPMEDRELRLTLPRCVACPFPVIRPACQGPVHRRVGLR